MRIILYSAIFLCLLSCRQIEDSKAKDLEESVQLIPITKDDISALDFIEFILDPKAANVLESWQKYYEIDQVIKDVYQADLSFFNDNNEIIAALLKDLYASVPEIIDTPLIKARLIALETKMLKLEGVVNLSNPQKNELLAVIREFLEAFSDLNLQINKKFEKDAQKIEKP